VELTHDEIAQIVGRVLGREIKYQSMPIEKWAELNETERASRSVHTFNVSSEYRR
jgi:hypothetical protein